METPFTILGPKQTEVLLFVLFIYNVCVCVCKVGGIYVHQNLFNHFQFSPSILLQLTNSVLNDAVISALWRTDPRTLCMLGKHSATDQSPPSL